MGSQQTHAATTDDGVTLRGTVHGRVRRWCSGTERSAMASSTGAGSCRICRTDLPAICPVGEAVAAATTTPTSATVSGSTTSSRVSRASVNRPVWWAGLAAATWLSPPLPRTASVNALAVFEPTMGALMTDEERAGFGGGVVRMGELAAADQLTDALRAAADYPLNDDEIELFEETGYFEAAARYVPNLLDVFRQLASWDGPTADDPGVLGTITVPVLVLRGEAAKPF